MIRHGSAPFLECSSKGDKRFSAFYARPASLKGKSIEEAYQAMKVFADGSTGLGWKAAKGKRAVNMPECAAAYEQWWREYLTEFDLISMIVGASGLSDMFGQKGHVCQATVLWAIRMDMENEKDARQAVRDSDRSKFTDDRRSYGMIREFDGAAFENSQAGRYEEQIHICHCCKTEWTETDVRESGGRFVPGWIMEKPVLSELDRSLIHHRVNEKLQSYRICHDCRVRNETALTKKDYEPVVKQVCRKIWTTPKQPSLRKEVEAQRMHNVQTFREEFDAAFNQQEIL